MKERYTKKELLKELNKMTEKERENYEYFQKVGALGDSLIRLARNARFDGVSNNTFDILRRIEKELRFLVRARGE